MLLKSQRNQFFTILQEAGINPADATEEQGEEFYRIDVMLDDVNCLFYVSLARIDSFEVSINPGYDYGRSDFVVEKWEEVMECFAVWAERVHDELNAPDLWAEAARAAQLFAPALSPPTTDSPAPN
jgi:hypothetical protein